MGDHESEISSNLERAATNLQVAAELLEKAYYDVSASRAYYAAFYAASALLLNEGIDTSKHSGVIALIHQHFVKTGKLNKEQGRNLNWLFELRSVGDYGCPCMSFWMTPAEQFVLPKIFLQQQQTCCPAKVQLPPIGCYYPSMGLC